MKSAIRIITLTVLCLGIPAAFAQDPKPAPQAPTPTVADPDAPQLTLDEKVSLVTDDLKRQDALEKANAAYLRAIAPFNEHQEATKKVIEAEHPGWTLETGQQGWHLVKKPAEAPKAPPAAPPAPAK
jgi:hypothetical protein